MSFRNFLFNNILHIIKNNYNQKLFSFQIGCFPSSNESLDHQYPNVLKKYKDQHKDLSIYRILIDKMYSDNKYVPEDNAKDNAKDNVFIYPDFITENDYNTMIEFSHFISNFNSISIVYEFTSIIREQYYNIEHKTNYLYIAPSECMADTKNILFNPILMNFNNNYKFYRPDKEKILFDLLKKETNSFKIDFLNAEVNRRKNTLSYFKSFLSIMRMDIDSEGYEIEKNFNKNYTYFYAIKKNIKYRLSGYEQYSTNILIDEFEKSAINNLEVFIYDRVFNILYDCLGFLFKDENLINENYDKILFNNDNELKKCIDYFI
uniref:Uncharacterized protein n=1 Tax=Mimiviridae sp. ChoanoV1 TaxID=2596887 RepID=A0A5B8IFR8_9VIRU|nr:hypothetical protein 1_252 [Mimiviridae sp. ChoanoV1]